MKYSSVSKQLPSIQPTGRCVLTLFGLLKLTVRQHIDFLLKPGQSVGCDFAGDVVALGSNTASKGISIGDAVAGFARGGFVVADNGAFQGATRPLSKGILG